MTMSKDTKRDMGKEELEDKVKKLSPEKQAFVKGKNVPKKFSRTLDPIFKYYFGRPGNEELLLSLVNGILSTPLGRPDIVLAPGVERLNLKFKKLTLLGTESSPLVEGGKGIRFDIAAETDDGKIINIEIQKGDQEYIRHRSEIYASNMVARYNKAGTNYDEFTPVISIWILEWELKSNVNDKAINDKVIRGQITVDADTYELATNVRTIYFVQLPKMKFSDYKDFRRRGIMSEEAEAWLRFLSTDGPEEGWEAMKAMNPEIARKLQQQEQKFWGDKAQRYAYIVATDQEKVRLTEKNRAAKKLKKAHEEGREEGLLEGLAKKEQEMIFGMLSAGFSDEQITAIPGITEEKLEKYKEEFNNKLV